VADKAASGREFPAVRVAIPPHLQGDDSVLANTTDVGEPPLSSGDENEANPQPMQDSPL